MTIGPNCGTGVARKALYGSSAAPLAVRHPDKTAAGDFGRALMAWISCRSALVDWRRYRGADWSPDRRGHALRRASFLDVLARRHPQVVGGRAALASAICRHYWPTGARSHPVAPL